MRMMLALDDSPTRTELMLFIVIALASLLAMNRLLLVPQMNYGKEAHVRLETLEREKKAIFEFRKALEEKMQKKEEVIVHVQENVHLQVLTGQKAPAANNLTEMVSLVIDHALKRNLSLEKINYNALQERWGLPSTELTVRGQGSYNAIIDYIEHLESLALLLHIREITLTLEENSLLSFEWKGDYFEMGVRL